MVCKVELEEYDQDVAKNWPFRDLVGGLNVAVNLDAPKHIERTVNCCKNIFSAKRCSLENHPWYLSMHQISQRLRHYVSERIIGWSIFSSLPGCRLHLQGRLTGGQCPAEQLYVMDNVHIGFLGLSDAWPLQPQRKNMLPLETQ